MRLPFLRSDPPAKAERGRAAAAGDDPSSIAVARTRARRRLIGALVLLLIGIIGFPILFETQPRPLSLDTPIEAPRGSTRGSGTVVTPPSPTVRAPLPVTPEPAPEVAATPRSPVVEPPRPASTVVATAPTPTPAPAPAPSPAVAPPPAPRAAASSPVVVAARTPASAAPAVASNPTPTAPAAAASGPGRFVVQVGAFTDAAVLRDTRAKVEKLGLKSYTQVIENDAGKRTRVRLGPFATRDEATAAAAKVKGAGLPANILAL